MVKVYFENDNYSQLIAVFDNESLYLLCLPHLELEAVKQNCVVTESIENRLNLEHIID